MPLLRVYKPSPVSTRDILDAMGFEFPSDVGSDEWNAWEVDQKFAEEMADLINSAGRYVASSEYGRKYGLRYPIAEVRR